MHTQNFQHWLLTSSLLEREGRECCDVETAKILQPASPDIRGVNTGAHEMLLRTKEYQENPEIQEVKKLYADVIASKFPELDNPIDRTNFFALLYDRVMPKEDQTRIVNGRKEFKRAGTTQYGNLWKIAGSNVANPWNIDRTTLKSEQQKMMDDVQIKFNTYTGNAAPGDRDRPIIPQDALILNVQKFQDWKKNLDGKLHFASIRVQTTQIEDAMNGGGDLLTREEYYRLLCLIVGGKEEEVDALLLAAKSPNAPEERVKDPAGNDRSISPAMRLREKLWANVVTDREGAKSNGKPSLSDALASRRRDILLAEMGPGALLSEYGIHLGHLKHAYICERQTPVLPLKPGEQRKPVPDAALWTENGDQGPMLLHQFLLDHNVPQTIAGEYIQPGDKNAEFKEALGYYFGDAKFREGKLPPKQSKEDILAIVALISDRVRLADTYVISGNQQRQDLRTKVNFGTKIENFAGDTWEYLKEFKEHPIGSALVAIIGVMALKKLWGATLGKDRENNRGITDILLATGVLAGAVELFHQNQTGKSLLAPMIQKATAACGIELSLSAKERVLSSLWADECKIDDPHQRSALSLIEEQPMDKMFEWYGKAKIQERTGKKMEKLPFSIKNQSEIFGQKSSVEISKIFYKALTKFFEHRGNAVKTYPWMKFTNQDNAAIGEEYLRNTYIEKRWFTYMATHFVREVSVVDDGSTIVEKLEKNGEFQEAIKTNPGFRKNWEVYKAELIRESKQTSDAKLPMYHIFTGEMDEGIASKMQEKDAWCFLKDAKRWGERVLESGKKTTKETFEVGKDSWEIVKEGGRAVLQRIETPGQTVVNGLGTVANAPKYFYDTTKQAWEILDKGNRVTGPIADSAVAITDAMKAKAKALIEKLKH